MAWLGWAGGGRGFGPALSQKVERMTKREQTELIAALRRARQLLEAMSQSDFDGFDPCDVLDLENVVMDIHIQGNRLFAWGLPYG